MWWGVISSYEQAKEAITYGRRGSNKKKIAYYTYAIDRGDYIGIKLYHTEIVRYFPDGGIEINLEGWRSQTTFNRLNRFCPYSVWSIDGYNCQINTPVDSAVFKDSIYVPPGGSLQEYKAECLNIFLKSGRTVTNLSKYSADRKERQKEYRKHTKVTQCKNLVDLTKRLANDIRCSPVQAYILFEKHKERYEYISKSMTYHDCVMYARENERPYMWHGWKRSNEWSKYI